MKLQMGLVLVFNNPGCTADQISVSFGQGGNSIILVRINGKTADEQLFPNSTTSYFRKRFSGYVTFTPKEIGLPFIPCEAASDYKKAFFSFSNGVGIITLHPSVYKEIEISHSCIVQDPK